MQEEQVSYAPRCGGELYSVAAPEMLIEDVLPACSLVGMSGKSGSGKTWNFLEMARALATGTPYLGRFGARTASVLIVGSDSSQFDYATQWRRLTHRQYQTLGGVNPETYGTTDHGDEAPIGDINPLSDRVRWLIQTDFSLDRPECISALVKASDFEWGGVRLARGGDYEDANGQPYVADPHLYQSSGVELIVLDTFGSMTRNDMLDNTLMIQVYSELRSLVERSGATVLLIHHNPKSNDESWLGAISQVGKLDAWIQLSRDDDSSVVNLKFKKYRGIRPAAISYTMNVHDEAEASLTCMPQGAKQQPSPAREANDSPGDPVIKELQAGPRTTTELDAIRRKAAMAGDSNPASRRATTRHLDLLAKGGKIVRVAKANGKRPALWGLVGQANSN